jgi:tetratricopeptide (TPR) repeat protein
MKKSYHLQRADGYYKAEQYDKAEIEYLKVLQLPPLTPAAVKGLGLVYFTEGKLPQAAAYLKKALELQPNDLETQLKFGSVQLSSLKLKEVRQIALQVLDKQPASPEALTLLVSSTTTTNELNEAWKRMDSLATALQTNASYHLSRSTLHLRQLDFNHAEQELKQALSLDAKSSAVNSALADFYLLRGEPAQAEPFLKTAADLAPLRSAVRLGYAEFKLRTGATAEAKRFVEAITSKAPDYLPAWGFLAEMAFAQRKDDECTSLVKQMLVRDPVNFEALMLSGNLALAKGDGTNAISKFERVISVYGKNPQVLYRIALAQLANQELAKSTATLVQATTLDPNFAEAVLLLAQFNIRQGDPASAIIALTKLTQRRPQLAPAYSLLVTAYLAQKNPDQALAVYRQMLQLFPKNPQVPLAIGVLLNQQNKKVEARQAFEKAIEISPDSPAALEQIVDLDLSEKKFDGATSRAKALIEKYPKAAFPLLLAAKIHLAHAAEFLPAKADGASPGLPSKNQLSDVPAAQPDLNEAEASLRRAIELDPDSQPGYRLLASFYLATGRHRQALESLNAIVSKTNEVAALMQIAGIHELLKEPDAAREAYEKVLKTNPSFGPALNNLAYLYAERFGKLDQAYILAEQARKAEPSSPTTADTLGWIVYRRGDYPRALALLQESATKLPNEPDIQFHLGMTHYMLGEEDAARIALEDAARSPKDFSGREEARSRLAVIALDPTKTDATTVAELEKKLQTNPNDPILLMRLGAVQESKGAIQKAIESYQAVMKLTPQSALPMLKLAGLYSQQPGGESKALELAKAAHSLAPDDPAGSHLLGRLAYRSGDFKWANSLLEASVRKLPNDPEVCHDTAWSYYSLGRTADAEVAMRRALDAGTPFHDAEDAKRFLAMLGSLPNPDANIVADAEKVLLSDAGFVPALMVCAASKEQKKDYKGAVELWERALSRFPLFTPAMRNLALVYFHPLGEEQKAFERATKARESFTDDPVLAKTLGILCYRRGEYPRSIQLLQQGLRKLNDDAESIYYLGMAQYKLKQHANGKESLKRALALNLAGKLAEDAQRVLKELK